MSDWETATSHNFGTGKANTTTMIDRWNSRAYGKQNNRNGYNDLWGVIQEQAIGGWFVPSSDEWTTILNTFNIGYENFRKLGLSASYWTSTQSSEIRVSMVGLFKKRPRLPNRKFEHGN